MPQDINSLVWWAFGLAICALGVFIWRALEKLDKVTDRLNEYATKEDLTKLRTDAFQAIENLRRGEVKDLHDILRSDVQKLRDEFSGGLNSIRDQIASLKR